MSEPTIADFMTRAPHTIGQDQTLATARKIMNAHGIRHLPVLEGGVLVGLLSQRDMQLIETLKNVDPNQMPVSEAMSLEVFSVESSSSLAEVVSMMAKRKYGSAVVVDEGAVVGVFTTIDALVALRTVLDAQARAANKVRASQASGPATGRH